MNGTNGHSGMHLDANVVKLLLSTSAARAALVSTYVHLASEIGGGKSTALEHVRRAIVDQLGVDDERVVAVQEPVDAWNDDGALAEFYRNPDSMATSFQLYAHSTRIHAVLDALRAVPDRCFLTTQRGVTVVVVMERSSVCDALFMQQQIDSGRVTEVCARMYHRYHREWSLVMPLERSIFIYLRPDFDKLMQRMRDRARACEQTGVPESYQRSLRDAHERVFNANTGVMVNEKVPTLRAPCLWVDNSAPLEDTDALHKWTTEAARFVYTRFPVAIF